MDDSNPSENEEETNGDWKKLASQSFNSGYREGAFDGKDSVFQSGFDSGYAEGFRNGFALGQYKGVLSTSLENEEIDGAILNTRRGNCQICTKKTENGVVKECIETQTNNTNEILQKLHEKYQDKCKVKLPHKLD